MVKPAQKRSVVHYLRSEHTFSIRQACSSVRLHPSSYYYRSHPRDDGKLIEVLNELTDQHPSYGFPKLYQMTRRMGYTWNHKRVYRVYKQMGLNLTRKRKRRLPVRSKQHLSISHQANEVWSMDFMSDALTTGVKFRTLNLIDDYNREAIWIEVGLSIGAKHMVNLLDWLIKERGKPKAIRVDNGPEFTSICFENWCHKHRIEIKYIQPGKPVQNAYIERFNRTYRSEVLDMRRFESQLEVRQITYQWLEHYNEHRPHESLGNLAPVEYLQKEVLCCSGIPEQHRTMKRTNTSIDKSKFEV